jgi:hypothetical protein
MCPQIAPPNFRLGEVNLDICKYCFDALAVWRPLFDSRRPNRALWQQLEQVKMLNAIDGRDRWERSE